MEKHDVIVEKELEIRRMKCACAWHGKYFGFEKVIREASPGRENDGVTHGICEECRAKFDKEAAGRKKTA